MPLSYINCPEIVALVATSTAAVVSAHGGDTTAVHACVATKSQTVRIIGPNDTC